MSMATDSRMRCGERYSAGRRDVQVRAGLKDLHAHGVSDTTVEAVIRHINEMISLTEDGAMMSGNPLSRYKLANMLSTEAQIVYDDGKRDVFDRAVCDGQVKIVEGLKRLCVLRASFCRQHKAELKSDSAMRKWHEVHRLLDAGLDGEDGCFMEDTAERIANGIDDAISEEHSLWLIHADEKTMPRTAKLTSKARKVIRKFVFNGAECYIEFRDGHVFTTKHRSKKTWAKLLLLAESEPGSDGFVKVDPHFRDGITPGWKKDESGKYITDIHRYLQTNGYHGYRFGLPDKGQKTHVRESGRKPRVK